MGQFDDIIGEQWLGIRRHGRMSAQNRAKIFLPFAALKGYEEAIEGRQKICVPKAELTEDGRDKLDIQFNDILNSISYGTHPMITITYYNVDKESGTSEYLKKTGLVVNVDKDAGFVQVVGEKIKFEDIYEVTEIT
ncbi:MAG: hypothetical protein ACI4E1_03250 [Lachnospira sp.]